MKWYLALYQLLKCMIGKHDLIMLYDGPEGQSKECRLCRKREDVSYSVLNN